MSSHSPMLIFLVDATAGHKRFPFMDGYSDKAVNEPSSIEYCLFELGSLVKIKCSSLAQAWDKPKYNVWTRAYGKTQKLELSLAWLDKLIKPSN